MTERVFLLLGTNLGDREKNLERAVLRMSKVEQLTIVNCSGVYESPAFEMPAGTPDFLNQAVELLAGLTADELLTTLKEIEIEFGRTDKGQNKSRVIDIDILLFGNQIIDTGHLTIPYRQLLNRPFAMIPLLEIAPNILHPVMDELISDYVDNADYQTVKLLQEYAAE